MEYGVTIFPTDYSISPAELAIAAEERDFDSMWFAEHSHIPVSRKSPWPGGADLPKMYYDTFDPFIALASAASVTTRIKLATGICLVVQRDRNCDVPMRSEFYRVAHQVAQDLLDAPSVTAQVWRDIGIYEAS